jgi:hypothetical protein
MPDDKTNRGTQDRALINLHEDYEVRYWTHELGVTRSQLEQLVAKHGNSVDKIRKALER